MRIEKYALQHKAQKKWYSYEYHFLLLIMSPILMKFYTINDSFVSSIKLIEPKIQDNYGGKRPYIGVLLSINDLNYFAPLSSYKSKQDRINNITVFLNSMKKEILKIN